MTLLIHLQLFMKGRLPFEFDKSEPLRFGLLPRLAEDESSIRWFEVPAMMIFHTAAALQEGSLVRIFACSFVEVGRPACCICVTLSK